MANYSQILSQRTFNLADGERYLITSKFNGITQVVTRTYKDKPIFTPTYGNAKTFTTLADANAFIGKMFAAKENIFYSHKVNELFEPLYVVKYHDKWVISEPKITSTVGWFIIGDNAPDTYTDRETALNVLQKCKSQLLEYHYGNIMNIKNITLPKIKQDSL
jgi:hypothetical protein